MIDINKLKKGHIIKVLYNGHYVTCDVTGVNKNKNLISCVIGDAMILNFVPLTECIPYFDESYTVEYLLDKELEK